MEFEQIDSKNLYKVSTKIGTFFYSYRTPIAFISAEKQLATSTKYSPTTSKHLTYIKVNFMGAASSIQSVDESELWDLARKAGL